MTWTADHQLGYVQGWKEGMYWGYFKACTVGSAAVGRRVTDFDAKCLEFLPTSEIVAENLRTMATQFYSRYPEDRALPIRRLLSKLIEPGMTVDGVHAWLDQLIASTKHF